MSKLSNTIHYKPLLVVGLVTSLHTLAYGLGYSFNLPEFQATVLYPSIVELMNPHLFGIILVAIANICFVALAVGRNVWVRAASNLQAFLWLFVAFVYWLDGAVALGVGVGLCWSLMSAYVAYAYRWRPHYEPEKWERGPDGKLIL